MKIFATKDIPDELNRTSITFISKIPGLETLNNYSPISLCNTVYKIVSEILVAQLRPLLANSYLHSNLLLFSGEGELIMPSLYKSLFTHSVERKEGLDLW